MKVNVFQKAAGISFEFSPEPLDTLSDGSVEFISKDAFIKTEILLSSLHPDVIGMIVLFIVGEFSDTIEMNRPVSLKFAAAATKYRNGKLFGPSSPDVEPRIRPKSWVPSLSFSGGVDSFAALQLMPSDTECFFLAGAEKKGRRKHPKSFKSGYRACAHIRSLGRTAIAVESDLEFVRSKVGLPDHLACAIPTLIQADQRSIGSITFGSIAEAAYRTGTTTYTELSSRHAYQKIHNIFDAIDLPVHNVVVGLSEVVTTKIVAAGQFAGRAQSCMWGGEKPCGNCIKCVRKSLLEMAITDNWATPSAIRKIFSAPGARGSLSSIPIKLENIYAYIAWKCPHEDTFIRTWRQRVRADIQDLSWMEKVIPSSLNYMIDELRPEAVLKLVNFANFMNVTDLENAKLFDLRDVKKDESAMRANADFQAAISEA